MTAPDTPDPFTNLLSGIREFARTTDEETGREILTAGVRQYLAELPEKDFESLLAEVRPPADTDYPANWGYRANPEGNH